MAASWRITRKTNVTSKGARRKDVLIYQSAMITIWRKQRPRVHHPRVYSEAPQQEALPRAYTIRNNNMKLTKTHKTVQCPLCVKNSRRLVGEEAYFHALGQGMLPATSNAGLLAQMACTSRTIAARGRLIKLAITIKHAVNPVAKVP